MLVVYVKLWKIEGRKQPYIAGKSFKIEDVDDVMAVLEWVEEKIGEQLVKEVKE